MPGAGVALMLVVSVAALLLWLLNPYTALLTVPAVHLWLLACLTDPPPPRRWRDRMVAAGALPLLLVALYYLFALDLDPLAGAWYLLLLVVGHQVGLVEALVASTLLGCGPGRAADRARRAARAGGSPTQEAKPRVTGPGGLAGPGSLGGTQSALRR